MQWDELDFWSSPAWRGIQEKLDVLDKGHVSYNPDRSLLFSALDLVSFDNCKVAIIGQDPYPQPKYATGVAFSIPATERNWPATIVSIFEVLCKDLRCEIPKTGDLTPWCKQGVLLWNAAPSYQRKVFKKVGRHPAVVDNAHYKWDWNLLTEEILTKLSNKDQGCVFAFLGARAREFINCVDTNKNYVIETSHPAPRGASSGRTPFKHSRLFSSINDCLGQLDHQPINWRL